MFARRASSPRSVRRGEGWEPRGVPELRGNAPERKSDHPPGAPLRRAPATTFVRRRTRRGAGTNAIVSGTRAVRRRSVRGRSCGRRPALSAPATGARPCPRTSQRLEIDVLVIAARSCKDRSSLSRGRPRGRRAHGHGRPASAAPHRRSRCVRTPLGGDRRSASSSVPAGRRTARSSLKTRARSCLRERVVGVRPCIELAERAGVERLGSAHRGIDLGRAPHSAVGDRRRTAPWRLDRELLCIDEEARRPHATGLQRVRAPTTPATRPAAELPSPCRTGSRARVAAVGRDARSPELGARSGGAIRTRFALHRGALCPPATRGSPSRGIFLGRVPR